VRHAAVGVALVDIELVDRLDLAARPASLLGRRGVAGLAE
jgi:hypothetical protein